MISHFAAYIRTMAPKPQKSPKVEKRGRKKTKPQLLGRIGGSVVVVVAVVVVVYYVMYTVARPIK